jgi:hypothetical protein
VCDKALKPVDDALGIELLVLAEDGDDTIYEINVHD